MSVWLLIGVFYLSLAATISGLRLVGQSNAKMTLPRALGGGVVRSRLALWFWLTILTAIWMWPTGFLSGLLKLFGRRGFLINGQYEVSRRGFERNT